MSVESEVAGTAVNSLLKISIEGAEFMVKISGKLAKHSAAMLMAALSKPKTKGQVRLKQMIKEGKPISIFTIKSEDLNRFSAEAKKYGVMFNIVKGKDICDIMVTTDQAQQLKRVLTNLKIGTVQEADESQYQKSEENINRDEKNQSFVDSVVGVTPERAKQSHEDVINQIVDDEKIKNPKQALTQDPPSKTLYKQNHMFKIKTHEKPSIKKEIKKIKRAKSIKNTDINRVLNKKKNAIKL